MGLDSKELDKISEWFNKSQLTSATIEYSVNGDYKLTLSREQPVLDRRSEQVMNAPVHGSSDTNSVSLTKQQEPGVLDIKEQQENTESEDFLSPIVGTFYRSSSPDAPPFVQVGDIVKQGSVLCILEAMKVMNELEADFDMEIVEILVESSQMVEYGQALFRIKRV